MPLMKTKAWKKHTARAARFERFEKRPRGISGYGATRHSIRKKMPMTTAPKMIRQSTVAESQGWAMPPNSSPSKSIMTPPTMVREPSQSTALRPSRRGVLGVLISRKKSRMRKATPSNGRFISVKKVEMKLVYVSHALRKNALTETPSPRDFLGEQSSYNGA